MTLFWKKGFHATSMQDLIDCLGINRASLYDTYGDKETLFRKSVRLYLDSNQARVRKHLHSFGNVREGFNSLFSQSINQTLSDPDRKGCFVVNTTSEIASLGEPFTDLIQENQRAMEKIFSDYLAEGVQKGQLSDDLDVVGTAAYLYAVNSGLMVLARINSSPDKLHHVVRSALKILQSEEP